MTPGLAFWSVRRVGVAVGHFQVNDPMRERCPLCPSASSGVIAQ